MSARQTSSLPIRGYSSGLTLLELSVVLMLIAAVAAGSMAMLTASIQSGQYNETVRRLQVIEAALLSFRQAFNRLPCPGDLTVVPSGWWSISHGRDLVPSVRYPGTLT